MALRIDILLLGSRSHCLGRSPHGKMTGRSIPSDFVKNVLQNGIGRYVCQLQRLTVSFCKSHGDSRGARDFVENHMLDFTKKNPGTVVYLKPRRHRNPRLVAEYLNGRTETLNIRNMPQDEICKWVEHFRTRSGVQVVRLRKQWHTETPSIQGVWSPFTNRDSELNVTEFPDAELSKAISAPTATDRVLAMAREIGVKKHEPLSEKE
ncbi:39S ribosomal protein L43, mitochondrial-like [Haliotis rufescens]|uniref:39S ribosomal protein L43, mitochondrial-like n=1 Tax=Haliotis rufescens TaxID=6454 RepID=UPI001EB058B5|nr:39S ribosomal protein L43, mitochondrial-like [Haliotis rufescens]